MEADWKKHMGVAEFTVQRKQRLEAERLLDIEGTDAKKARAEEEFYLLKKIDAGGLMRGRRTRGYRHGYQLARGTPWRPTNIHT